MAGINNADDAGDGETPVQSAVGMIYGSEIRITRIFLNQLISAKVWFTVCEE